MSIAFNRELTGSQNTFVFGVNGDGLGLFTAILTQIQLLSSESDTVGSVKVKMQKLTDENYGQAKLIARIYYKKDVSVSYSGGTGGTTRPQPKNWFMNQDGLDGAESRVATFGLAQSEPVLIEGNLNNSVLSDVTFTFTTPFTPSSSISDYVVVIMPLFEYGQYASVDYDGMQPSFLTFLQTSNGFVDKWVKIAVDENPSTITTPTADSYYRIAEGEGSGWVSFGNKQILVEITNGSSSGGGSGGQGGNGGGAGGGNSPLILPADFVLTNSRVVVSHSADPRSAAVRLNDGSMLPSGSVVKNTVTGQKFIKIDGTETDYMAISIAASADWDWTQPGESAWDDLQGL